MKWGGKTNYERECQQLREAYCGELVAQTWFEHGSEFPPNQFLAQLLHLLSDRFNIEQAKTQILEQLSALPLSAKEEIQTSLPTIEDEEAEQILANLTDLTHAFVAECAQSDPAQEDFARLSTELIKELITSRYYVVQNYLAKDQNRRRNRWIQRLHSARNESDEESGANGEAG